MLLALYVDDLILASNKKRMLEEEKAISKKRFEMEDLGEIHFCFGIQIEREREKKKLRLHQSKYFSLLKKFGMQDENLLQLPLS